MAEWRLPAVAPAKIVVKIPADATPGDNVTVEYPSGDKEVWTVPVIAKVGQEFTLQERREGEREAGKLLGWIHRCQLKLKVQVHLVTGKDYFGKARWAEAEE